MDKFDASAGLYGFFHGLSGGWFLIRYHFYTTDPSLLDFTHLRPFHRSAPPPPAADIARVQISGAPPPPPPPALIRPVLNQGFIDPKDPSIIYVAQPRFDDAHSKDDAGI